KISTNMPTPDPKNTKEAHSPSSTVLVSHRGRKRVLQIRDMHLKEFKETAKNSALFWRKFISMAWAKSQPSPVSANELRTVFEKQMNPIQPTPSSFNADLLNENIAIANAIPDVTVDSTPEQFFDRPFTAEQVDLCKLELEKHPSNSA
ncbi:hypothetical protein BT96DRAFT_767870, partial [Gymnopus androsaceus JB14]